MSWHTLLDIHQNNELLLFRLIIIFLNIRPLNPNSTKIQSIVIRINNVFTETIAQEKNQKFMRTIRKIFGQYQIVERPLTMSDSRTNEFLRNLIFKSLFLIILRRIKLSSLILFHKFFSFFQIVLPFIIVFPHVLLTFVGHVN